MGEDYLSKLQNNYKPKDAYVYRPAPTDINSPKYGGSGNTSGHGQTAILSEIINMNNIQKEMVSG